MITELTEAERLAQHVADIRLTVSHWEREERNVQARLDRTQQALLRSRNALAAAEARVTK